jgi:hypothetical protein
MSLVVLLKACECRGNEEPACECRAQWKLHMGVVRRKPTQRNAKMVGGATNPTGYRNGNPMNLNLLVRDAQAILQVVIQ